MNLGQITGLFSEPDDVYIYDAEDDFLDCGMGCHTKYFKYQILDISLRDNHICVKIDY